MNFDATRSWHYVANGQAAGPVPGEQLRSMAASGAIRRDTKIWTGGMSDWVDAGSFADLFAGPPAFSPPPPQPAYTPQPQAYAPPQQPAYQAPHQTAYAPQQPAYGGSQYQPINSPYMAATGQLNAGGMAPVHYAGFWIRVVAFIIDAIILGIISFAVNFALANALGIDFTNTTTLSEADTAAYAGAQILIGLVGFLYFVLLHSSRKQATWGKQIVGIHLMHANGGPVGFWRSLGRYFATIVSGLILGIGYLMAGWTDQKKALHDMICDTRVVYGRL